MADRVLAAALVIGAIQGVVEWLPVSSQGVVAIVVTGGGYDPVVAVRLALFLHAGTALAATGYYRGELVGLLRDIPGWRPGHAFDPGTADLSFYAIATLVSAGIGVAAYLFLLDLASALAGGAFIALIGLLLVATGVIQRRADAAPMGGRTHPDRLDAVLVGVGQGIAILPGISRSGTTTSFLLLRGHDGESSFRLSFVLSIPASLGAGLLAAIDLGGLAGLSVPTAAAALGVSAIVGYLTIGILMRAVRRISFASLCVALGVLAVAGGLLIV